MGQSVSYHYWAESNKVRIEVIQVDNGASHVNVSANFQLNSYDGAEGYQADPDAFNNYVYYGDLTAGQTYLSFNGTNGTYSGSGWKSIATKWVGTIPRSAGTFKVSWATIWEDTYETQHALGFETPAITIMAYVQPDGKDALQNYTTATLGSSVTFTIKNSTAYAHTDTLSYSIGTASGTIQSGISVPANGTKTVTWTPPATLGAQIKTTFTGTCTLTLTTGGQGSDTYSCQITVPSYTYSMSAPTVAKQNYAGIGGSNYVAQKHTARFTMPSFPAAMYGATLAGEFYIISGSTILYQTSVTSGGTVDYTSSAAGNVTGTCRVTDSRGVQVQQTKGTTWVANPLVTCSFTAKRSGSSTTVNLVASGTYSSTISGLGATLEIKAGGTPVQSAAGSSGTASLTTTDTLALASSQIYECSMTDTLGNSVTKRVTVPAAFFYIQVGGGDNGKGVSIGRAASTSGTDTLEIGLPTIIDGETQVNRFFPYLKTDADGNTMLSAWEVFLPRVTRSMLGLPDNTVSAGLEAYLKWVVKNVANGNTRTRGLFTCGNMYAVDVEVYTKTVDASGAPQYSAGIAYTYGRGNLAYRFGTNNYAFYITAFSDIISRSEVYRSFLETDTNNVSHATDSVIHAPHVGYADLGLTSSSTRVEGYRALTDWLKTNYASNALVNKSRCIVHGTFAMRSNGSIDRNAMYEVMFYDISQSETNDTPPRYCTGFALELGSDLIFKFRNNNGTFRVYSTNVTEVTT